MVDRYEQKYNEYISNLLFYKTKCVINGKISSNAASKEYGVQIDENTMSVDEQATRNLREAMANSNLNWNKLKFIKNVKLIKLE